VISERARAGFERLFAAALAARLARSPDAAFETVPVASEGAGAGDMTVVLTISSIRFRLLFMLAVADNEAARAYYAPDSAGQGLREAFLEVSNLCCGVLSQGLQAHFPDLGMSTPYVLGDACLAHLDSLKPGYLSRQAVTIDGAVHITATMCICPHADIDFVPDPVTVAAAEVAEGELELF
jgi:hypothetical protein